MINGEVKKDKKIENESKKIGTHTLYLDKRNKIYITGVKEVYNYSENVIELDTIEGNLMIKGENIHLEKMSLESSELSATGRFDSIQYKKDFIKKNKFIKWLIK